jgi:hypothetical protein
LEAKGLFAMEKIQKSLKDIFSHYEKLLNMDTHHQNYKNKIFCISITIK